MNDKPGLICPICNEGLATLATTANANLMVKCVRCGYVFLFVRGENNNHIVCNNACAWIDPYGWVPEAGCPVHDNEEQDEMPAL